MMWGIHRLLGMFTSFKYFLILPEVTFESQSTTLKSFELSRKSETFKVHNLLHSFEVSNYHLVNICSANNRKNCQFDSQTVFHLITYDVEKCRLYI